MLPIKLVVVGKQKQVISFALPRLDKTNWAIYYRGKNSS
jgi:hypothetical protein